MDDGKRTLQARLARMDLHFDGEMLDRAHAAVGALDTPLEELTDFQLWAVSVSAYSRPEIDVPVWVR